MTGQIFGTDSWGRINCDDSRGQELVRSLQDERERMNTRVAELEVQIDEAVKRAEQAEADARKAAATVAELVAANNQVAAINADLTEQLAAMTKRAEDAEAILAALPTEAAEAKLAAIPIESLVYKKWADDHFLP